MNHQWLRSATAIVGGSLIATFLLATASLGAEPIRVLVVMPAESGKLARQVTRFEDALRRSRGPVVQAASLADADAVVDFTSYRRVVNDGKAQDWWYGHYVLLKAPSQEPRSHSGPESFSLVVGDREDWQVEPVLEVLGTIFGRALGLTPEPQKGDVL